MPAEQEKQHLRPIKIWRCKTKGCKAWVRDELAAGKSPNCPLCKGTMVRSIKHLPELITKYKKPKAETVTTS